MFEYLFSYHSIILCVREVDTALSKSLDKAVVPRSGEPTVEAQTRLTVVPLADKNH